MPGRKSPYGIQVDSPDQRQWMSFESIGSIRRIAAIVCGAAASQRALKWRSPTVMRNRAVAAVMRTVGEQLGNTPAVARASYVSPAVVEQYLDGRTVDDFRPRHLRIVGARDMGLDLEEQALLSLLRSWRIRRARQAA